jgi:hypothetical protein
MTAVFASAVAAGAHAQLTGRPRDRSDAGSTRSPRSGDANPRGPTQPLFDPVAAIERELPSLRIDLKLTADQTPLFDSFERQVRVAAEAGRMRARHLSAFRVDEGIHTADTVPRRLPTTTGACQRGTPRSRADDALYGSLSPEQRKYFDRRIIQSLRDPLGST